MSDRSLLSLAVGVVRGETPPWPTAADPESQRSFFEETCRHGLQLLVADRLTQGQFADWPVTLRACFDRERRRAAAVELVRREELVRVLGVLTEARIPVLLFKGAALGYTHYPQPWLRPRVDTDLLVPEDQRATAMRVLETLGYTRSPLVDGSLVMRQAEYVIDGPIGISHAVDLHWRVGNPQTMANLFSFEDLWERAVAVPALDEAARAPCSEQALLIACVHHVIHHGASPRLIWRHDVHRLAGAMDAHALRAFAEAAVARHVARLCASELAAAATAFATRLALATVELDAIIDRAEPSEPSSRYLHLDTRPAARLLLDLQLLPSWRTRMRVVGQHLFPSPAYMHRLYRQSGRARLPVLYAHRLITGVWRWLRRPAA